MNDCYWYIVPQLRIDRKKYKGRGRPRGTDYYTDSGQMIPRVPIKYELPKDFKQIISIGK